MFRKLAALGTGGRVSVMMERGLGLGELMALALIADRYQVEVVQEDVEEKLVGLLTVTVESCGGLLTRSSGSGPLRVVRASRELARREFDDLARTEVFLEVGEDILGSLPDDDSLGTERE